MCNFNYKAKSQSGETIKGSLMGDSLETVRSKLLELGLTSVRVSSAPTSPSEFQIAWWPWSGDPVKKARRSTHKFLRKVGLGKIDITKNIESISRLPPSAKLALLLLMKAFQEKASRLLLSPSEESVEVSLFFGSRRECLDAFPTKSFYGEVAEAFAAIAGIKLDCGCEVQQGEFEMLTDGKCCQGGVTFSAVENGIEIEVMLHGQSPACGSAMDYSISQKKRLFPKREIES